MLNCYNFLALYFRIKFHFGKLCFSFAKKNLFKNRINWQGSHGQKKEPNRSNFTKTKKKFFFANGPCLQQDLTWMESLNGSFGCFGVHWSQNWGSYRLGCNCWIVVANQMKTFSSLNLARRVPGILGMGFSHSRWVVDDSGAQPCCFLILPYHYGFCINHQSRSCHGDRIQIGLLNCFGCLRSWRLLSALSCGSLSCASPWGGVPIFGFIDAFFYSLGRWN